VPRDDGEARIRVFFAVELGDAARAATVALQQQLRRGPGGDAVRWVRPEGLHVTLRFLGEIEATRVPALVAAVGPEVSQRPAFELRLGALSGLPTARRPRVAILDVEPAEPLEELAAAVERGVVAAGIEPEMRRFRAHLTLGRVRGRYGLPPADERPAARAAFDVSDVVLFRSQPGRGGSRYTPLERLALGGPYHPTT